MTAASISCRCGSVQIQLSSATPRITTECCCNHCFNRLRYLEQLGSPPVVDKARPSWSAANNLAISSHNISRLEFSASDPPPVTVSKFDNKFTVPSGRNELFAYKMSPETMVINIASRCCYTFLLGRHPVYDEHCVTTCNDVVVFDRNFVPQAPTSRWFANQWDSDRLAPYDPLPALWVKPDDGSVTGGKGWEKVFQEQVEKTTRPVEPHVVGETFDDVLATIGSITIVSSGLNTKVASLNK